MNTYPIKRRSRSIGSATRRVARWIAADALIGGVSGAVYGLLFGSLGMLTHAGSSTIVSLVLYFAICGFVAGALLGIFGAMVDNDNLTAAVVDECLRRSSELRATSRSREGPHRVTDHVFPENRLADLPATNRPLARRLALRIPSRN